MEHFALSKKENHLLPTTPQLIESYTEDGLIPMGDESLNYFSFRSFGVMSNCLIIHSSERMTVSATGCIDMRLSSMTRRLELFGGLQLLEVPCNVLVRFSLMRDGRFTNNQSIIYSSPWFGQVTRTNQPTLVGFEGKPGDQLILWTFS